MGFNWEALLPPSTTRTLYNHVLQQPMKRGHESSEIRRWLGFSKETNKEERQLAMKSKPKMNGRACATDWVIRTQDSTNFILYITWCVSCYFMPPSSQSRQPGGQQIPDEDNNFGYSMHASVQLSPSWPWKTKHHYSSSTKEWESVSHTSTEATS